MRSDVFLSIGLLTFLTLSGASVATAVARRVHRFLSFRVLVITMYLIVNVVSGIVHIIDTSRVRRGYFDAVERLEQGQLVQLTLIAGLGLISISLGILTGLPKSSRHQASRGKALSPSDRAMLPAVIAVLLPVSLWALSKVQEHASTLDTTRVISVSGGYARYYYLSTWFASAIFFIVIWLASRLPSQQRYWKAILLISGILAIITAFQWTGGRAVALVMSLPLILVMIPQIRAKRIVAVPFGAAISLLFLIHIVQQGAHRRANSPLGTTGLADWLDWEWGRFSMLGFALQHEERYGLLYGETISNTGTRLLDGLTSLVGLADAPTELRSSTQIAAQDLLNSNSAIHVVPGMSAELYLNFGIIGLALGYYFLGRLCSLADEKFCNSGSLVTQLFWAYVGTILVFKSITLDSAAAIMSILYIGTPLLLVAAASSYTSRLHGHPNSPVAAAENCEVIVISPLRSGVPE